MSSLTKSKVPAYFPPLLSRRNKVNQTCITTLIMSLVEVKARYIEQIDYHFDQNIVEKSFEAKDEYQRHLKVGVTFL